MICSLLSDLPAFGSRPGNVSITIEAVLARYRCQGEKNLRMMYMTLALHSLQTLPFFSGSVPAPSSPRSHQLIFRSTGNAECAGMCLYILRNCLSSIGVYMGRISCGERYKRPTFERRHITSLLKPAFLHYFCLSRVPSAFLLVCAPYPLRRYISMKPEPCMVPLSFEFGA